MAMIGSGHPIVRRVASIATMTSTVPMATSRGRGFPIRKARSSKIDGTYRTEATAATASPQSSSGMPPGAPRDDRRRPPLPSPGAREDQEDQRQHEGHMDAAMQRLLEEAEAGGPVMEDRQREKRGRHQRRHAVGDRPESHLRVEALLQLPGLAFVQALHFAQSRPATRANGRIRQTRPSIRRTVVTVTSAIRPRDRSAPRRDGGGFPRRRAPSPCGSSCPWRVRRRASCGCCRSRAPW